MPMSSILKWTLILMPLFLAACGSAEDDELRKYINRIKTRPAPPIEPLPDFKPLPSFTFPEEDNRRTPFKPRVIQSTDLNQYQPDLKRKKEELESFPLDALKFVGTLKEGTRMWALIIQPEGKISHVKVGDHMGQNFGKIIQIKNDAITLEEVMKINDKWEKKTAVINLQQPN